MFQGYVVLKTMKTSQKKLNNIDVERHTFSTGEKPAEKDTKSVVQYCKKI